MERAPQHKSSSPTDFANRNINICSPVAVRENDYARNEDNCDPLS